MNTHPEPCLPWVHHSSGCLERAQKLFPNLSMAKILRSLQNELSNFLQSQCACSQRSLKNHLGSILLSPAVHTEWIGRYWQHVFLNYWRPARSKFQMGSKDHNISRILTSDNVRRSEWPEWLNAPVRWGVQKRKSKGRTQRIKMDAALRFHWPQSVRFNILLLCCLNNPDSPFQLAVNVVLLQEGKHSMASILNIWKSITLGVEIELVELLDPFQGLRILWALKVGVCTLACQG